MKAHLGTALSVCLAVYGSPAIAAVDGVAVVAAPSGTARIPVRSWRSIRDNRTVKQNLDYSCGSAAKATILNEYYGVSVSEEDVLKAIDRGDLRATFQAMQQGLSKFGFRAVGVATTFQQLQKLRMPAILYVRYRKSDHFSVLRGIDDDTVLLADPSLGNRTFSHAQFQAMWETRSSEMAGKLLAIFPVDDKLTPDATFFESAPRRQTEEARRNQALQTSAQ